MRCIGYFYAITRLLPLKRNKMRHHTDTVTLYRYSIYEDTNVAARFLSYGIP